MSVLWHRKAALNNMGLHADGDGLGNGGGTLPGGGSGTGGPHQRPANGAAARHHQPHPGVRQEEQLPGNRPTPDEWSLPWKGGVARFVDTHNRSVGEDVLQRSFWVHNNPNNQRDTQNCVQIDRKRGSLLNDLGCNYNNYFTCQKIWPESGNDPPE
ncbi:hypothetical protein ACOMHN_028951 [Nucella lapillus]